jgi:hypothetical protein
MQSPLASEYQLIDVHKEIDLFDRKIAYCQNYEKFDSEVARASALKKLGTKRASLVKVAEGLASQGITCDPKYLPRSFKAIQLAAEEPPQVLDQQA